MNLTGFLKYNGKIQKMFLYAMDRNLNSIIFTCITKNQFEEKR